jgi:hypothetical protein
VGVVSDHFLNHVDQVSCFFLLIIFHGFLLHFNLVLGVLGSVGSPRVSNQIDAPSRH